MLLVPRHLAREDDDEEPVPDSGKKVTASKDKPGTAATKATCNLYQEQKRALCSLPQVESPQAAAKAAQESDEDEEDGSSSTMWQDR